MTLRAVVGLGANLGDRLQSLREALRELGDVARVEKSSRVYETEPSGGPAQPDYLNAAALVSYSATPIELLRALLAIEARMGRVRRERWGPRVIDLDLLWIDGIAIHDEPELVVPHPRLRERAFALAPLLDVVPDARDPLTGERYAGPSQPLRAIAETL